MHSFFRQRAEDRGANIHAPGEGHFQATTKAVSADCRDDRFLAVGNPVHNLLALAGQVRHLLCRLARVLHAPTQTKCTQVTKIWRNIGANICSDEQGATHQHANVCTSDEVPVLPGAKDHAANRRIRLDTGNQLLKRSLRALIERVHLHFHIQSAAPHLCDRLVSRRWSPRVGISRKIVGFLQIKKPEHQFESHLLSGRMVRGKVGGSLSRRDKSPSHRRSPSGLSRRREGRCFHWSSTDHF